MTPARKIKTLDAFLAEVRKIGVRKIKSGCDAGDPLAQVGADGNVLEWCFNRRTKK